MKRFRLVLALLLGLAFTATVFAGEYPDALRSAWKKDTNAYVKILHRGKGVPTKDALDKAKALLEEAQGLVADLKDDKYQDQIDDCKAKIQKNLDYCDWWLNKLTEGDNSDDSSTDKDSDSEK